jgi:hypothetical protein
MVETRTKEAGSEPDIIYNILQSFPIEQLDIIKWVVKPDINQVKKDLDKIAGDIFYGRDNSVARL